MKPDSEKLKSRTALSMNDADWANVNKSAKIERVPVSQFLREAANAAAAATLDARRQAKKKGER